MCHVVSINILANRTSVVPLRAYLQKWFERFPQKDTGLLLTEEFKCLLTSFLLVLALTILNLDFLRYNLNDDLSAPMGLHLDYM